MYTVKANEISETATEALEQMAADLKQDIMALRDCDRKTERMRLFRLFRVITEELHRRRNPANSHLWN